MFPGKEQSWQVFLEYYLIKVNQFDDVARDRLDEWIYFLKNESRRQIARAMRAEGVSIDLIAKITGLSADEIAEL